MDEQHDLIEAIHFVPSPRIDRAVHAVFLATIEFRGLGEGERIARDDLVMACMTRLAGGSHDDELRSYLAKRIKEIESGPDNSAERYRLESLRELLKRR